MSSIKNLRKECRDIGKVYDVNTKRCRESKKKSPFLPGKICSSKSKFYNNKDYICNPKTGVYVKKSGPTGKAILSEYDKSKMNKRSPAKAMKAMKAEKNNIKVLTYNIFWRAMLGENKECKSNECKYNIANILHDDEYDFVALQETIDNKILNIPGMRKIVNNISVDRMHTYFNIAKYRLQYSTKDELQSERPITILFLRDLQYDNNNNMIMFINLHAGHYYDIANDKDKYTELFERFKCSYI